VNSIHLFVDSITPSSLIRFPENHSSFLMHSFFTEQIYGAPRQARGTIITPRWGEHPVPEDQFTHGQGRGPLGTGIESLKLFMAVKTIFYFNLAVFQRKFMKISPARSVFLKSLVRKKLFFRLCFLYFKRIKAKRPFIY